MFKWLFGKKEKAIEWKPWSYQLTVYVDRVKYEYKETRKFKERVKGKNYEIRLSDEEFIELDEKVREFYRRNNQFLFSRRIDRHGGIEYKFNSAEISFFYESEWVGSWY
jgi:hypothetical protein